MSDANETAATPEPQDAVAEKRRPAGTAGYDRLRESVRGLDEILAENPVPSESLYTFVHGYLHGMHSLVRDDKRRRPAERPRRPTQAERMARYLRRAGPDQEEQNRVIDDIWEICADGKRCRRSDNAGGKLLDVEFNDGSYIMVIREDDRSLQWSVGP